MLLPWSDYYLPSSPLHPAPPTTSISPFTSCPWDVHTSSLASALPILFLTSPCQFCTYNLYFLFFVPFSPISLLPFPADNPPCDLHLLILFLFSCLLYLCFCFCFVLGSVVSLLSFYCSYFRSSFFVISPFNISYHKGLMMMNSFNMILSGKHFIGPFILNDSFAG